MSRHRRPGDRPTADRHGAARHRGRRTFAFRVLAGVLLVVAAAAAWMAWSGLRARDELTAARTDVSRLRAALVAGDHDDALEVLDDARTHAANARGLTGDPLWRAVGTVPFLGRTPRAITEATDVLAAAVDGVLPDLVDAASRLAPGRIREGDRVDVAAVAAAQPSVDAARAALAPLESRLTAIDLGGVASPVATGVVSLRRQVGGLSVDLAAVSTASRVLPSMLGSEAARHYLVVFQNNAESRGTGGLVGAYAVVTASAGRLTVDSLGTDSDLRSAARPVLDLGPQYEAMFGDDPALWANTNLSAHFPYAARQQLELWRRQHGQQLDGVIAVDPVTLGYLLEVTGPARLPDGTTLNGSGIAALTLRQVYARYPSPTQNAQRKQFLQAVATAALTKVLSGTGDSQAMVRALGRAAGERRLLVYSAHADEEALIAGTAVSGVVDDSPGPYVGVAFDNASGSKIDFYTAASLSYVLSCTDGAGAVVSTVTLTLHDGAPSSGLPEYAGYRLDRGPMTSPAGLGGDGSVLDRVLVYLAEGAQVTGATLDGGSVAVSPGVDGAGDGRPVVSLPVELKAGQTRVLVLQLTEPTPGARIPVRAWVAPLVQTPTTTVTASTCR